MLISIILPVYNVSLYLDRAISSLIQQKMDDVEFIFVNDGSTDDSLQVLKKWEEKDSRIKIFDKKNEGSGYARNFGLNKSSGEYIYFMDPDDWVEADFLEEIQKMLVYKTPELIIFGHNEWEDTKLIVQHRSNELYEIQEPKLSNTSFNKVFDDYGLFAVWNKVYKKSFLEEYNLSFNNFKSGQDAIFNIEMSKKLTSILILDKIFYNYVAFRKGSAQSSNYSDEKFENNLAINKAYEELYDYYEMKSSKPTEYLISITFKKIKEDTKMLNFRVKSMSFLKKEIKKMSINLTKDTRIRIKLIILKMYFF